MFRSKTKRRSSWLDAHASNKVIESLTSIQHAACNVIISRERSKPSREDTRESSFVQGFLLRSRTVKELVEIVNTESELGVYIYVEYDKREDRKS